MHVRPLENQPSANVGSPTTPPLTLPSTQGDDHRGRKDVRDSSGARGRGVLNDRGMLMSH